MPKPVTKYEYDFATCYCNELVATCNARGLNGWRVVTAEHNGVNTARGIEEYLSRKWLVLFEREL